MRAMVLAAGYGVRLGPLTQSLPKVMLEINGKPLLEHILVNLRCYGVRDVMINLHSFPEKISSYFRSGDRWGLHIRYSREHELLGTAGSVKNVRWFFEETGEPFCVHYGDVLTDQDLAIIFKKHTDANALATLLIHKRAQSNSIVQVDENWRVKQFLERPSATLSDIDGIHWVNSGIYVCDPAILEMIPEGLCDFPRHVFMPLAATASFFAVPLSGFRCAVDSPERLQLARDNWKK